MDLHRGTSYNYSKANRRKKNSEMSSIAEYAKLFFCFREQQGEGFIKNFLKSGILKMERIIETV